MITFVNKGRLSLIDLTTMGDSSKRDNPNKIGKYDSGLKYAIAILVRNKINFEIFSGKVQYKFTTSTLVDEETGKTKEVIVILKYVYEDGAWLVDSHINTAFSPKLGYDWEFWMAFRELYSNCLDEDGLVIFDEEQSYKNDYTIINIYDHPMVEDVRNNWGHYFLHIDTFEYKNDYSVYDLKIYQNDKDQYLKLYKNKILIYKDVTKKSRYIYDYSNASIDEKRVLNKLDEFKSAITYSIMNFCNEDFINDFLSSNSIEFFESSLEYYHDPGNIFIKCVNKLYTEDKLYLYPNLRETLIKIHQIEIGERRLKYSYNTNYSYSTVKVVPLLQDVVDEEKQEETFEEKIKRILRPYLIIIEYPIAKAKIERFKVMADSFKQVLYISESFDEQDIWELLKAIYMLKYPNDSDQVFKDFVNRLFK